MEKENWKEIVEKYRTICAGYEFSDKYDFKNIFAEYAQSVRKEMFTKEELETLISVFGGVRVHPYKLGEKIMQKLTELTNILEEKV